MVEETKNSLPARVRCGVCKTESIFSDCIKEEYFPSPYEAVVEGIVICPHCGDRKHIYFMTSEIRVAQAYLAKAVSAWEKDKKYANYAEMTRARDSHIKIFDAEQAKYREIFEKVAALDGTGN